tara:strand:+ start:469 stop:624 length:156 start_codon:yes stop_codon:yes gene_type:complete
LQEKKCGQKGGEKDAWKQKTWRRSGFVCCEWWFLSFQVGVDIKVGQKDEGW